jgi:pimeloyl-ACP methyl ester carboxylesterase
MRRILFVIALFLALRPGPVGAATVDSLLIGYVDKPFLSKGISYPIQIWERINIICQRTKGSSEDCKDYDLRIAPNGGPGPFPVSVYVAPYRQVPSPPSSNPTDAFWASLARSVSGPHDDYSLPESAVVAKCHTQTGEVVSCKIPFEGTPDLSDIRGLTDVGYQGTDDSNADWDLENGRAVVVCFTRYYAGLGNLASAYTVAEILVDLKNHPAINHDRITIYARSQGGTAVIHALALLRNAFGPNFNIAVVAEGAWPDGPGVVDYYRRVLPDVQPRGLLLPSLNFAATEYNRLAKDFGPDSTGPAWQDITINSLASRWPIASPILLLCGTDDMMVPVRQCRDFAKALTAKGILVQIQVWENGDPLFEQKSVEQAAHGVMDWNSLVKRKSLIRCFIADPRGDCVPN